jgi:hypothetical protein
MMQDKYLRNEATDGYLSRIQESSVNVFVMAQVPIMFELDHLNNLQCNNAT